MSNMTYVWRWLYLIMLWAFVFIFYFYVFPLERLPSATFSYIWAFVLVINSIDYLVKPKNAGLRTRYRSFLVGLLIGSVIISVQWTPIDETLIVNLFITLSPLFQFGDVFFPKDKNQRGERKGLFHHIKSFYW